MAFATADACSMKGLAGLAANPNNPQARGESRSTPRPDS